MRPCPAWESLDLSPSERLVMLRAAQQVAATLDRIPEFLSAVPGRPQERRTRARMNGPACGAQPLTPSREPA